jgi:hypothetical protein
MIAERKHADGDDTPDGCCLYRAWQRMNARIEAEATSRLPESATAEDANV